MKEAPYKNISNIKLSKECYIRLKVISIENEVTIQEVAQEALEKAMSRKKHKDNTEET